MVANPNRPARTEEEKLEEQFKEKRLRQRIDRYLESQGLLKYQTKGMSQAQVAQKFAEAGVKLRASELVNYKPTQTTTQTTTQPTLAPQKQPSGFYYAKGKKSFSPTSLRINTSDVKTVITTPQTTISDTAASEPFFRPKSSLVIPPSEIDRKLKEYAEVALEYKKYRIPIGTKSDLAEAALKEDTALVAFGNLVTREGEVTRVVTDSQAIRDRARLEIAYDNDIKAGKMWAPMKAVKLAWYDISNLGALDNFGIVQDLKNFITDENSYGQIFNAAFRAGQFILEGDISQVNRVLISYTGSPLQVMNMSTEEKIDMLTTEVLDDYKTKLEDYTNKYEKSSGLQKVGYWAAKQWYGWVVDDIIDTEISYRGMNTAWELYKNLPVVPNPRTDADAYKEHIARMKEIQETESEQAKNRIPVIENQVSALRAQLGQSEEQDAIVSEQMIELTIEKQTLVDALNNTYSEYGAYTWSGEPDKYLEFRRNLAIAELQKGAPLTRREIWRIKSLSANPAAEGFGELIFDITNLTGFASKAISAPIKSSKIYITATTKIDDVTKTVLKTADNFLMTAGPKIPLSGATAKFFGRTSVPVVGLAYSSAKVLTSPVRRLFRPAVRTVANKRRDLLFNILGSVAKSFDSTDKFGETLGDISRYLSMANSAKDAAAIEKVYQTMITTVPGTAGITFNQFLELRSLVDDAAYGIDPKNLDWAETYIESANKAKEQLKQTITNRLTNNGKKPTTLSIIREVDEAFFRQSTPSALINVIGDFSKKFEDSYIDAFRSTMNAGWFGRKTALTTDTLLGRMALGLYMLGGDVTSRQAQAILNYTMDESLNWGKALRREVARFSTGFSKRNAVNLANLLSNVDYVFNIVRSLWINAILTLNPRYYLSNYIDNTFRTISYGGNPFQDVELMYRSLPSDIVESALRSPLDLTPEAIRARQLGTVPIEIGQGLARTDISFSESVPSKLMYQGWKPRFGIFSFWNEEYKRLAGIAREQATTEVMKGIQRGGVSEKVRKVFESTSLLWKSLINGSTDFNTAIEFSFRLRIFHNQYFKELSRAAPIYTNEVVKGLSKNLSETGKLIYENSVDPNEILAKVDDMTDPKNARPSSWFSAISQETLDLMKGLSQSEKVTVMTAIRRNMVDYLTELGKAGQKVEPKHIDEFVDSMMDELRVIMSMYQSEADRLKNINTALQTHPTDINLNPPTDIVDDLTGGAPSSTAPTEVKPAKPSRAQKVFDAKLDRIMEDGISLKKVSGEDFAVVKNDDGSFTVEIGENAKPQTIKDALSSLLYSSNETYISKTLGLSRSEFLDMVQSMVKNPVEFESKNSDLFYDLSRMIDNNIGDNLIGSDNRVKINLLREDPNYTAIQLELDGFEDAEARMGFTYTLTEEKQIAGRNAAVANVNMMNRVKGVTNPELSAEMVRFNENQSLMHSSLLSFYREVYPLQRNSYSAAKMEKYHRLTTQLYIREAGLRNKFEKMLANEDEALRIISEFNDDYITNWLKEVGFTDFKFDLQAPSVRSGETEPFQILTSFSMMDDAGKKVTRNGAGLYSDITTRFQRYMYSAKNLQQVKFNVVMKFDASGVDNALADAVRVAFNLDNKTSKTASKFLKNYAEWKLRMRGLDVTTENIVNALKTDLQFSRLNFTPSGAQFYEMRNAPGVNAFTFIGTGSQNVEGFVKQLAELYVGELSKISSAKAGEASLAARRNASQQLQAIKNAVSQATGKPFIGTVTPSAKELTKETAENIAVLRQLFTNYIFSGETGNKKFARVFKQMRQFLAKQFKDTSPAELRSIINTGRFATDAMPDDLYAIMDNLIMGHNADNFDESGSKVRLLRTLAKNHGWNFKTDEQLLQLINNHATVLAVTPAVQRRFIDAMLAAGRKRDEAEMAFEVMQTAALRWGSVRNRPADEFFTTLFIREKISGDGVAGLFQTPLDEIEVTYAKDLIANSLGRILSLEASDPDLHRIYTDIIAAPIYRGPNVPYRPYSMSSEAIMMKAKMAVLNKDENATTLLRQYVDALERDGALPIFIEQFEQYVRYRTTELNVSLRTLGAPPIQLDLGSKSLSEVGSVLETLDIYEKGITDVSVVSKSGMLHSMKLTEAGLVEPNRAVNTEEFKRFFNGSKVLDESGDPLIVFHSTDSDFLEFEKWNDWFYHFGTNAAAKEFNKKSPIDLIKYNPVNVWWAYSKQRFSAIAANGRPMWQNLVAWAGNKRIFDDAGNLMISIDENLYKKLMTADTTPRRVVMPFYINISNPLELPDLTLWEPEDIFDELTMIDKKILPDGMQTYDEFANEAFQRHFSDTDNLQRLYDSVRPIETRSSEEFFKALDVSNVPEFYRKEYENRFLAEIIQNAGYDGIKYINAYEDVGSVSWIAFNPNQIKSFYNGGDFGTPNNFLMSPYKGKYWRSATERFIELGDKADASTFFHEFWHDYVADLMTMADDYKKTSNSAFKFASEDLSTLEDYTGLGRGELLGLRPVFDDYRNLSFKKASGKLSAKEAKRLEAITKNAKRYEAAQEKIANAGLKYMASGKVETPELKGMFERLAKWLKGVWTEINSLIGDKIPKEVARVFERAFAPVSYTKLPERYSSLADVDLDAFRLTLGEEAEARAIEELNFAFDVWKQQEGALRGFPAEHLESPSKFASYLKMRLAESERAEAETYRTLLFKLEHLMDEVGAMADPNYVKIGNVVPPKSIVPPELLSVTKVKEDNIRILESLLPTMEGVRKDMHRRLITGEFIPNLTAEEVKEFKEWAKVAAKYKADMNEAITYGGILKGADGQILFRSEGALPATNDIMIDYSTRNNFDNLMRGVFPFWMFPSRSIPFWLKTIATHPGYLSMYLNVQRASQAYRYQHGAVDRNGRPLQSLRGFIPLGNTGLWVNPYQQTSAKYVLDLIAYAGEMVRGDLYDSSEDVGPATQVLSTLVENGPLLGLHPAPWMKFLFQAGVPGFPKDSFATFPLAPQLGLVPRHHLAYIFNLTPTTRSFFDKWVYPEVSWRDTDIERILLEQYLEDEASGKFETDEDLEKARKEVEAAIIEKGTNPIWNEAAKEYDDRRADVNRLSFFTGVYLKSYSDGKAQIYETKNYVETLKWAVNDPFMTANMGLPVDPVKRDEFLNAARFETSDAWLYNIYDRTGWVRSESGKVLTDPAERNSRLSELLQNDAKLESLYAEAAYAKRDAEIKLSKLPIGAYGTPEYNEIQGDYLRRINEIYNSIPPRDYYGREGTSEGLELKLRNDWWRRIQATMPVWDMRNEEYTDYEKRVDAWKTTLPELAKYMAIPETTGAPDDRGEFSSFMATYKEVQKFLRKNQSLDPNLIQKLIDETTAQGYDEWRRSNDDLPTALNEVYRIEYLDKYYDASEGLPTFASELATEQWLAQNPEPTIEKFTAWLGKYYPGRFTQKDVENLFANIDSLDKVYSVSERKDAKSSDYEKKKQEIWEILWMAGPNKQKKFLFTDEFTDSRTGLPNASDYLTAWYFSNGKLWDNGNRDSQAQFEAFYQAVTKLAKEQGVDQPTMADLQQFAEAESLNLEFTALVTDRLGEKFLSNYDENQAGILGEYLSMDKAGRRQFRNENPEEYKLVQTYYDMRDEFAAMNPLWSQFYVKYDPDFDPNSTAPVPGAGSPASSGGASYGGGGGQQRGGRRGRRGGGGGGGGGAPAPSTGGTPSIQWPDGIINFLSSTIMQEISAYFASGTPLSASTIQYLRNLAQNHPEWADFINQIING